MTSENQHIVFKIEGGTTRSDGKSLCRTCRHATLIKGVNNQVIIDCRHLDSSVGKITFDVVECNRFECKTQPTLYEMEEVAWRLVPKKGQALGFVDPTEFARLEKQNRKQPHE